MNRRLPRLLLFAVLPAAGCLPGSPRVCLTPPYDAPGGFSETYHEAVTQRELMSPIVGSPVPYGDGVVVGPPVFIWPGGSPTNEPPL